MLPSFFLVVLLSVEFVIPLFTSVPALAIHPPSTTAHAPFISSDGSAPRGIFPIFHGVVKEVG
jgi:hypothetical protein